MSLYISFDGGSGTGKGTFVEWCREYFSGRGKRTAVLRDNQLDPLRDCGASMLPWCEKNNINRNTFLLPVFAAGAKLAEAKILEALGQYDVVLRDRSFITSLAYTPSSDFDQKQIWDLYVEHVGIRVPDVAVIVDADVDVAVARIEQRKQKDIGLGGKMSGNRNHRLEIREQFLTIPEALGDRLNVIVVQNNGTYTENPNALRESIELVGLKIVEFCRAKGVLS